MWSALQASPFSLVLLMVWFPKGCTLDTGWTERMEHVLLVGGRLCVNWGCPLRVCVAYFSASPAIFPPLFRFVSFFFFVNWSHQCGVRGETAVTPPNLTIWSLMDVLLYTLSSGGWVHVHFMAHYSSQALGVFIRLSGEVREELRGVCSQTFMLNFLKENSFLFYFTTQDFFL